MEEAYREPLTTVETNAEYFIDPQPVKEESGRALVEKNAA
jgi:hypothetical protein